MEIKRENDDINDIKRELLDQAANIGKELEDLKGTVAKLGKSSVSRSRSFAQMIGVNTGKQYDELRKAENQSIHEKLFKDIGFDQEGKPTIQFRVFHSMEDDYEGAYPSKVTPGWKTMSNWIYRYQHMKSKGYSIRVSFESIFEKDSEGELLEIRKFPNKWFNRTQWGGDLQTIKYNAKYYLLKVLKHCRVDGKNGTGALLIDEIEIGNEPWGEPGIDAYKSITKGFIEACKEYYQSDDPNTWEVKLVHAAFQVSHPDNYIDCTFGGRPPCAYRSGDYVKSFIDEEDLKYIDELTYHAYAFDPQNGTRLTIHPESKTTHFDHFKEMATYAKSKGKRLSITEFGWNSSQIGALANAAYLIRALLLFAKHGIYKTYAYELVDDPGAAPFESCGLYKTVNGIRKPGEAKRSVQELKQFLAAAKNLTYKSVVAEDDNHFYIYKIGPENGDATHIVVWRPIDLNGKETDITKRYDYNGINYFVGGIPKVIPINGGQK